jgi:hypothetical protein
MGNLKDLKNITKSLRLVDPQKFVEQGRWAYRMIIERSSNPLKKESERALWDKGWKQEQEKDTQSRRYERNGQ